MNSHLGLRLLPVVGRSKVTRCTQGHYQIWDRCYQIGDILPSSREIEIKSDLFVSAGDEFGRRLMVEFFKDGGKMRGGVESDQVGRFGDEMARLQ